MLYHACMTRIAACFVCCAMVGLLALACTSSSNKRDSGGAGAKSSGAKAGESAGGKGATSGGDAGGVDAGADPSDTECETASDCGYGEIEHEIVSKADCVCLYGCPYLPLNQATIERRKTSHAKLCDPRTDGKGQLCGVDDCVPLTAAMCVDHVCRAAPR